VVAVVAATVVILSGQAQKVEGDSFGVLVTVIVSKADIPVNTCLDPLIEKGLFEEIEIPTYALVDGWIPNVDHLRGTVASLPILANEQISSSRLTSEWIWELQPSNRRCLGFSAIEHPGR
jgi:Flp pilus assembly protein CpaB